MIGWWTISGTHLLNMLRRCYEGESPDLVYAEEYANSELFWKTDENDEEDEIATTIALTTHNDGSEPWIAGSEWSRDTFRRTVLNDRTDNG